MITFACKRIELDELVKCAFELNKTDCNLFIFLLKNDRSFTVSEIMDLVGLDRTTVQKALKRLFLKELIERSKNKLSSGGFYFKYQIKDRNLIKHKMKLNLESWYKAVEKEIERL